MNINPMDLLKNVQNIREQMGSMQEKLARNKVTGSSGGGMVELDFNGKMDLIAVRISREAMDMRDVDMLQDLIKAAHVNGLGKAREAVTREVGTLAAGAGIPPGFMENL
jgi:DNA-binding YbaB/EbfC family protein